MLSALLAGCMASLAELPAAPADPTETVGGSVAAIAAPAPPRSRLWLMARGVDPGRRITILGAVYPDSWLVEAPATALRGRQAVPFDNARKSAPSLLRLAKTALGESPVALEIVLRPNAEPDHLAATLAKLMPELAPTGKRSGPPTRLIASVPGTHLKAALTLLQQRPEVLWLDRHRPLRWLNAHSVEPIQANADSGSALPMITPIWDQGLIGSGQIIALADSGLDRNETWFTRYDDGAGVNSQITDAAETTPPAVGPRYPGRKVVAYWVMPGASPYDDDGSCNGAIGSNSFHGTHVTGTAAGDGGLTSSPGLVRYDIGDGMAPHAQILFQDLGNDQSGCLSGAGGAPMWAQAKAGGARIHSNSYGAAPAGGYTADDLEVDDFLWRNEDMLIVFAAGNGGPTAMSINHPGNAKHVLTVGALNHGSSTFPALFSSRGPASDGRLKPDLMAPGLDIVSARGNDNDTSITAPRTLRYSGTSMATPAVAGAAAMVRQYFTDGFYPTGLANPVDVLLPSGPLLKALLLNGTRAYPDTPAGDTGWGRVWLDSNLYFAGDNRGLRVWPLPNEAGLEHGESHQYRVQVGAGEEFRATLVWYDPAPSLVSPAALVNDLDLVVTPPAATPLLGNVFVAGESAPGGSADALNPVEQVRLTAPAAGLYTVQVNASLVLGNGQPESDRQGYALVVSAGRCTSLVTDAPQFTLASDATGVQLAVDPVPGAEVYQFYRARGRCTQNPAGLQFAGASDSTAIVDRTTHGGFRYAYRVRAADACGEGPVSDCREIISQAPCTLAPSFATEAPVARPLGAFCAVELSWSAGAARCNGAGGIGYDVHRSTDPFFVPTPASLLQAGVAAARFTDYQAPPDLTHYYRVVAVDGLGNAAPPTAPAAYSGVGTETLPGTYADGGEDLALAVLEPPWRLTGQVANNGARSYRSGPDGLDYPANTCAALTTRPIPLQPGASLSYAARYQLESGWDGVVVEVSADGGVSWTDLPPDAGYPDDFSLTGDPPANACGYPASRGAFSSAAGAFATHTSDLSAWAGETVLIRWRISSDSGVELDGFHLDDISVSNAGVPIACLADELVFTSGYE